MIFIVSIVIGILLFFYFFLNRKKETTTITTSPDFIASDKFNGEKKGYVFKNCNEGVGYYKDTFYLI